MLYQIIKDLGATIDIYWQLTLQDDL